MMSMSFRTTVAGAPATTVFGGTSSNTTALAPTTDSAPIEIGPSKIAPAPITQRSSMIGTPHRRERPPIDT
jgi:hypothetical protein